MPQQYAPDCKFAGFRAFPAIKLCFFFAALVVAMSRASAQDGFDEIPTGLLGRYSAGPHQVERVDPVLSFDWGGGAPDERLPAGPFSAEWTGNLLCRLPGQYRFHAFISGDVTVQVDGTAVLNGSEQWAFVSGELQNLAAGDHKIIVRYNTPAESDKPRARLAVFWSSDQFTLEPIPADVLSRDDVSVVDVQHVGRRLTDALRCAACHGSSSTIATLNAPALDRVRGSQTRATLVRRIRHPETVVSNSHMPGFGFSDDEASAIADFLLSVSKDPHDASRIPMKKGDVSRGQELLLSLGCAACHQVSEQKKLMTPPARPYDGPELLTVARRRSPAWLDRWLRAPETLNARHRMPSFELSKDERRQLVAALSQNSEEPGSEESSTVPDAERIAAGRKLVMEAGCAACHEIPGIDALAVTPLTVDSFASPNCLRTSNETRRPTAEGRRLPKFSLMKTESKAIQEWVSTLQNSGQPGSAYTGQIYLERNGCLACHDRNLNRGLSSIAATLQRAHPNLSGQSQSLIPPSLTAVGDKLNDDYLRLAVAGEQKTRRLPWLKVRMPKFRHSDRERAAIVHHLTSADRIPDEADAARPDLLAHTDLTGTVNATTEDLLLGNQLAGAAGFNCVACHRAGEFEPRNVAPGTRGSDIMTMGERIRPRFFQRWMKNPIRVVRGIEMPAIRKGVPDILEGSLPAQIGVLWQALSDDRFTAPTVTSRFEQVVHVAPEGPARVIRDVFTIGFDKNRIPIARAMAIGFPNLNNLLVDLDTMQIRHWTVGEFARQRTEGKSWYWDMPGSTALVDGPLRQLVSSTYNGRDVTPVEDEGRHYELISYRPVDGGIEIITRAWYDLSGDQSPRDPDSEPHFTKSVWADSSRPLQPVVLRHQFLELPMEKQSRAGWQHVISLEDAPAGFQLKAGSPRVDAAKRQISVRLNAKAVTRDGDLTRTVRVSGQADVALSALSLPKVQPPLLSEMTTVTSVPGFTGTRLPIRTDLMPTALTWLADGRMAFTSLKGHVWIAEDTDGDGIPDTTSLFEEGLAAPFGILADGDSLLVSHKPEILRLTDTSGDGRADSREVVASGWGYNDNYHDWASGLIRDAEGNMYVGLGSDYSQKKRPANQDRWRGGVIRIDPSGIVTPLGMSMRYPMGLAIDSHGNLFATDNQGVQNTFNEINHILPGRHYGVPSAHQPTENLAHETPALMVPHPWTRSVNSILFLPDDFPVASLRGHGIGCEYDSRFLIRFTVQNVNGTLQGASYRFSLADQEAGGSNFIGPICSAVAPDGSIYIGSIWDSGWQGGQNTGGITSLRPSRDGLPNGIRELTATADGFQVEFFEPIDVGLAAAASSWSINGYTRKWGGSYATPDSDRYTLSPSDVKVSDDGRRVRLSVADLRPGFLYSLSVVGELAKAQKLWPSEAHYSMKVVPQ